MKYEMRYKFWDHTTDEIEDKLATCNGSWDWSNEDVADECGVDINGNDVHNVIVHRELEPGELQDVKFVAKDEYIDDFYGSVESDIIEDCQTNGLTIDDLKELARGWSIDIGDVLNMVEEM